MEFKPEDLILEGFGKLKINTWDGVMFLGKGNLSFCRKFLGKLIKDIEAQTSSLMLDKPENFFSPKIYLDNEPVRYKAQRMRAVYRNERKKWEERNRDYKKEISPKIANFIMQKNELKEKINFIKSLERKAGEKPVFHFLRSIDDFVGVPEVWCLNKNILFCYWKKYRIKKVCLDTGLITIYRKSNNSFSPKDFRILTPGEYGYLSDFTNRKYTSWWVMLCADNTRDEYRILNSFYK